jgi:hypothetical protein
MALRLVTESDSIVRSSLSFCLRASSIAPSSARELDAVLGPLPSSFSAMFRSLPFAYQTPMPADAFSHPFFVADPSVLIVVCLPLGVILPSILAGVLSLWGSLALDLCPGMFPSILIPPSRLCVDLGSGLYRTGADAGSRPLCLLILWGVP